MEKSSLDYRKKLYSQIQEEYGKLVYTYTCHFKMADRLSKRNFWIKWGQIGLSAISTGGFLGVLISNDRLLHKTTHKIAGKRWSDTTRIIYMDTPAVRHRAGIPLA